MTPREAIQEQLKKIRECESYLEHLLKCCCDVCGDFGKPEFLKTHSGLCVPCFAEYSRDMDKWNNGDTPEEYDREREFREGLRIS